MGSFFSRPSAQTDPEQPPVSEQPVFKWYPPEADLTLVDNKLSSYAQIHEKANCLPHKNGNSVIIFYWHDLTPGYVPDSREVEGWAVEKLRKTYEHLQGEHPRIVQYSGSLRDGSVVVEKLWPGPLVSLTLPTMTLPASSSETASREAKIMLSLYYRWALQSLSALSFLHAQGVYLRNFSDEQFWVRSDFSLALTAFINAVTDGKPDPDYGDGGWAEFEYVNYPDDCGPHDRNECPGSVKEDLFYWATFVWRLLTNGDTWESHFKLNGNWEPNSSEHLGLGISSVQQWETLSEKYVDGVYTLEDERLGPVLRKAWKCEYDTADEATKDVKLFAERIGITVHGDEVVMGEPWSDIFEVVEKSGRQKELRIKPSSV